MVKYYLCVFCLVLFAAGCGEKVEEKVMENKIEEATGADAEVDISEKGMKVTGEMEGGSFSMSTGESTEIPKEFPSDVLIYQPSEAVAAVKTPEGYSVSLKTGNDAPTVAKTYKQEMKAKGWSEQTSMNMGNQSVLVYEKENRVASVMIAPTDDQTQITLTVGKN